MTQHIGQDFTSKIELNMLPHINVHRAIWQTTIQYTTEMNGQITMHHQFTNMHGNNPEELTYVVGRDVHSVNFVMHCHNSFPTRPNIYINYTMRIDHLILLNLACKLLNKI